MSLRHAAAAPCWSAGPHRKNLNPTLQRRHAANELSRRQGEKHETHKARSPGQKAKSDSTTAKSQKQSCRKHSRQTKENKKQKPQNA